MDDIRKKIFIIAVAVIGMVIAAVLVIKFYNQPGSLFIQQDNAQTVSPAKTYTSPKQLNGGIQKVSETIVPAKSAAASEEVYVKQLAGIFVERFLSYSNQNNNQHIEDVLLLSTDKMASWIKKQGEQWGMDYQGSSAKVVASMLKEMDKDSATIGVDVQQSFEGKEKKIVYKSGRVELVKVGDDWKIDGFFWE